MARIIELLNYDYGQEVRVTDGNTVTTIRADESDPTYQQLKAETNNFTENMNVKTELEVLSANQSDLIYTLMMNGVV
jgi:hypothetical protein